MKVLKSGVILIVVLILCDIVCSKTVKANAQANGHGKNKQSLLDQGR